MDSIMHDLLKKQAEFIIKNKLFNNENTDFLIEEIGSIISHLDFENDALHCLLRYFADELKARYEDLKEEKSKRHDIELQLNNMSCIDYVTGLSNKKLLNDRINQSISLSERNLSPFYILLIGIDNFSLLCEDADNSINTSLLKAMASLLTSCTRESDVIAYINDGFFAVLLVDFSNKICKEDACIQLESALIENILLRILNSVTKLDLIEGGQFPVTCSIGISSYPDGGTTTDELLKNAKIAHARAVETGSNKYHFFDSRRNSFFKKDSSLYISLLNALNLNEFELYYQPQAEFETGAIIGLEALIRWKHPEFGLLSPIHFIPLAEETGLIIPIGEWVLRQACNQIVAWVNAGFSQLRVSVNLSARQFLAENLVVSISEIINDTGIAPSYLEVELTESYLIKDLNSTIKSLNAIRSMGVKLAIDDFGTGYSSLSYLTKLPVDTLKIDKSFVRDIADDKHSAILVKAIISIAHELNMRVIAEGVETEEQCRFLVQCLCDEMQGFYFSKPQPAAVIENILRENKKLPYELLKKF